MTNREPEAQGMALGRRIHLSEEIMNQSIHIKTREDLEQFVYAVDGLHDALLHEVVMLHPGYVNPDRKMFGDSELPSAQMVVQSQSPDIHAVRLDLKRVSRFRVEPTHEFQLEGELEDGKVIIYPLGKRLSALSEIRAAEVEYVILGKEFLGEL